MTYWIPKQHGAWSVLAASFVVGAIVGNSWGGAISPALLIFAVAVVAGFLARHSVSIYLKSGRALGFVVAWASAAIIAVALLIFNYQLRLMLLLCGIFVFAFTVSLILERKRLDREITGEIINMCGLSIVAPTAAYTMTGVLNAESVGLWALCALFFNGSVFRVRYIAARREMKAAYSVIYHVAAIVVVTMLSSSNVLPKFAALALIPSAIRAIAPVIREDESEKPSLKRIGFQELAHTAIFVGIVAIVFEL